MDILNSPGLQGKCPDRLSTRPALAFLLLIAAAMLLPIAHSPAVSAQTDETAPPVYIVSISGTIDLGLAPYLERVLDEAAENNAAAVILEIDTLGGRLDAVLQMKDALLSAKVPTVAYVNRTAFSAGALIAVACEKIYMDPAAVMGAATPVDQSGDYASQKVVSAVRKTFKSTAEARGRDPIVAEAMVDQNVEIDGLDGPNELLTLTTTEAIQWGYADGVVGSREALLAELGLANRVVRATSPSFVERFVRFVTDPVVASLLISAAILLIIGDLLIGGFGVIGGVGLAMLALFFWGHNLAGLAGWEDVALVILGLALVAIEVFVIPGFGVPGLLGLGALALGFWLAMVGGGIRTPGQSERAGWTVAAALLLVILGTIALFTVLPKARRLGGLVLQARGPGDEPIIGRPPRGWLRLFGGGASLELPAESARLHRNTPRGLLDGAVGVAVSDLRPSGNARFDERTVDVVTRGEYLFTGDTVIVLKDEGYRRIVRRYVPGLEDAPTQ